MGMIFDIKEMAVHDGPGIRTTVFLKGCPLRCRWCHNPEGLSPEPQLYIRQQGCTDCGLCRKGCGHPDCRPFDRCLHVCPQGRISLCGREMEPAALAQRIWHSASMADGVTFSGGEPLMQTDFVLAVCGELDALSQREKRPPMHKALETSGFASEAMFRRMIAAMDLVYFDVKLASEEAHKRYTGVSNQGILRNLEILRSSGIACVVRTPLIPNITDTKENLEAIRGIVGDLTWETLAYNSLAGAKYPMVGLTFDLEEADEES